MTPLDAKKEKMGKNNPRAQLICDLSKCFYNLCIDSSTKQVILSLAFVSHYLLSRQYFPVYHVSKILQ